MPPTPELSPRSSSFAKSSSVNAVQALSREDDGPQQQAGVEAGRIQGPWVCKPAWLSRNWGGGRWALTTHGHHHSLLGPPLCLALCLGLHVHNLIYPTSHPFRFTPKETEAQRGRVTHPLTELPEQAWDPVFCLPNQGPPITHPGLLEESEGT